jgi:hypothetical protein
MRVCRQRIQGMRNSDTSLIVTFAALEVAVQVHDIEDSIRHDYSFKI